MGTPFPGLPTPTISVSGYSLISASYSAPFVLTAVSKLVVSSVASSGVNGPSERGVNVYMNSIQESSSAAYSNPSGQAVLCCMT